MYHLRRIVMYNGLVHVAVGIEADIATIVTTLVGHKYFRMCIVEMTSCIARIDSECPVASRPDHRTIEVSQAHIPVELPAVQHEAEVSIAAIPPDAEDISMSVEAHQVIEVDFIYSLILCSCKVELVSHLVGEEEGFVLCCVIAHCVGRDSHDHHHLPGTSSSSYSYLLYFKRLDILFLITLQRTAFFLAFAKE